METPVGDIPVDILKLGVNFHLSTIVKDINLSLRYKPQVKRNVISCIENLVCELPNDLGS